MSSCRYYIYIYIYIYNYHHSSVYKYSPYWVRMTVCNNG